MVLIGAVPFCADIALVLFTLYSPSLESAIGCGKNTYSTHLCRATYSQLSVIVTVSKTKYVDRSARLSAENEDALYSTSYCTHCQIR